MQIIKYKDLSDAKELVEVEAGKSLKEVIHVKDWSKYAIIINGVKSDENYILKESDLVAIRSIPGDWPWNWDWSTVGEIALGVITAGIYTGVKAYQAKKESEKALEELEKIKNATRDDVTNVPYLKGASNTVATGKTQPYIIGRHLFTPYILNAGSKNYKGYHTISGEYGSNSFYNVVLENGFNKQILESISCDDVQISQLLQGEPQENNASNSQFYFTEGSVFASDDSYIEIAQDGQPFEHTEFNKKIIEQEPSSQLKKANDEDYEDLYFTLEKNSKACDVCIMFNGLYYTNKEGTKSNRDVTVIPYWSADYAEKVANGVSNPDTAATWNSFVFEQLKKNTTTVLHGGRYSWRNDPVVFTGTLENYERALLSNPSAWPFISGEDLRNNAKTTYKFSFDYKNVQGEVLVFGVTIMATYQETVEYETKLTPPSNTFSYNQKRQLRFEAHADFPFSACFELNSSGEYEQKKYPITVKLVCPTDKVSSGTDVSDCYVQYIHSHCYDVKKSAEQQSLVDEKIIGDREAAKSTLLALHIKSTLSNEDKLKKVNVVTNGLAYIKPFADWDLTQKVMTNNPASWLIEVLSSDTHKASKVGITDEIDLASFGELYDYCEYNGIGVNMVLTNGQKKADVLESILDVCHATLYQNIYGKIAVAIDSEKENAIAVLNEQNLVSFQYEKEIALNVDGLRVKYIDADSDFQENSFIRLYEGGDEDSITENTVLKDITLTGVTNYRQAWGHAYYLMANEKIRPITAKAVIGAEGFFFLPLAKVKVQHPSLKTGLGNAVIKDVIIEDSNIIGLELYDDLDLNTEESFYVVIQCVGDDYCSVMAKRIESCISSDGTFFTLPGAEIASNMSIRAKTVYFSESIPLSSAAIPHNGDVLSYGNEIETTTREMLITEIQPNGTGQYMLTLVDYDERIYEDSASIPEYHPVISERKILPSTPMGILPEKVPDEPMTSFDYYCETQSLDSLKMNSKILMYKNGVKSNETFYCKWRYFGYFKTTGTYKTFTPDWSEWASVTMESGEATLAPGIVTGKKEIQVYSDSACTDLLCTASIVDGIARTVFLSSPVEIIKKSKTGVFSPSEITFSAREKIESETVYYSGRFVIEHSTDGSSYTTDYTSVENETYHNFTIPSGAVSVRCSLYASGGTETLLDRDIISVVQDGTDGGYRDYQFAVGDFDLTDQQARTLEWFDAPPTVPDGKCLYMATKWIS